MVKSYLMETHPLLVLEIDTEKQPDLDLAKITTSNPRPLWWLCEKGHSYSKAPYERTRIRINNKTGKEIKGAGCPVCANKKIVPGINDLKTTKPHWAKEWHPTKNTRLTPTTIASGSIKKVWWLCDKGHEWEQSPYRRTGCPVCANSSVLAGFNDLATTNPQLAAQWHPTFNLPLTAAHVTAGANQKVWWLCDKGHEWEALVASRGSNVTRQRGCPVCANKKVLVGFNDLATTHPELIKEINLKMNQGIELQNLHSGSSVYVIWTCSKNDTHTWRTIVAKRAQENQGCPKCSNRVSQPEEELYEYLRTTLPDETMIIRNTRSLLSDGKEIDIYIPSLNFAIEYNGLYWHSERKVGRTVHYKKWKELKNKEIQLFTVWEDHWLENKNLIKNMIATKLKQYPTETVYARNTTLQEIDITTARTFLDAYHLQGYRNSTKFYGLFDSNKTIVSILSVQWDDLNKILEISRFSSNKRVPGGFSKLLKYALSQYPETLEVLSYSDNSISLGNLYKVTGFEEISDNVRSYFYAIQQKREHRRNYTKQKYKTRTDLIFQEGLTESQLAELNNLDRVWDAGNTKWVKTLEPAGE